VFLQLLQRNADYHPHDVAIVYGDESITHADLLNRVERVASGLRDLGVAPGDRVSLLLENSPEFLIGFFAVAACRGVNVPLNIEYKEEEVRFYLADAGVKCVIADAQRWNVASRAAGAVPQDVCLVATGSADDGAIAFSDLQNTPVRSPCPNASLDDDVVYIYSSGSTGRPKCAPRTVVQYWWEMDDVITGLALGRDDAIFCTIPLFHNFGAVHCMLASIGSGARLVMLKSPNPFVLRRQSALSLLENERVTIFPAVPFIYEHLIESSKPADLSSIRVCYSAAAALSLETADAFFAKFEVPIRDHYGCTEVGAMTIDLDPVPRQHGRSVGKPFPGVRVQILDEDGQPLPPGERGEVVVSSRQMTRGYLGLDELNQEAFKDGAFHTGDLGHLDAEGRLFLQGRKKFIIDITGHKVDPIEVEDALAEHDRVLESVVVGVSDDTIGHTVIKAYVVADSPCSDKELIAFCRARLANFKVPHTIEFISEIPKNTLGKVIRKSEVLDQLVSAGSESQRVGGL
jgi:long-chain acyl-CoA synthetase